MSRQDLGAGDMDWMRGKVLLRPDDQLQLTEAVCLMSLLILLLNSSVSNFEYYARNYKRNSPEC